MRVLVTGGAGYIGSHVVDLLVREGHDVTVLDSLEKGHREAVHPSAGFVQGDCGDAALLDGLLAQAPFEAVMHFAAYIEAGESMVDPGRFFVNNTARTLVLLDRLTAHGIRKFIFSSTAATYGNPEYTPIDEEHPKSPTNAYGYAKLLVEGSLEWMNRLLGLSCASLRYFNASGCGEALGEDHSPETHLIPLVLEVAQGRRAAIKIFGTDYPTPDGTCIRDYIHILDLARAHAASVTGSFTGAFNLGTGTGHSVRQVIEAARRVTGRPVPVDMRPRRPGDPARLVADYAKAKAALGWTPAHSAIDEIVESAWKWASAHPRGYAGA